MATTDADGGSFLRATNKERALVLGGGGPVGIAWEAGLAAGLHEGGVDLTRADLIVGTSAGSFVGAQLAGRRDPASLARAQIELGRTQAAEARDPNRPNPPPPDLAPLLRFFGEMLPQGEPSVEILKRIGAFALATPTISEAEFLKTFGSIAEGARAWPEHFVCTAVDAESGAFKAWSAEDGIPLARGIASSCCVPGIFPPVEIDGRRWMDGGMRSSTSADLAAGYERVLIVAVVAGASADPRLALLNARLERERAKLADGGGASELITPDEASLEAFGANLMNGSRRAEIAEAGWAQGRREAQRLGAFWN
jgi:NTE family protein